MRSYSLYLRAGLLSASVLWLTAGCATKDFVTKEVEKSHVLANQEVDKLRTEMQETLATLKSSLEASQKAQRDALDAALAALSQKSDATTAELATLKQGLDDAVARLSEAEGALDRINQEIQVRNETLKEEIQQALLAQGSDMESIREEILQLRSETSDLTSKTTEDRKDILIIQNEMGKLTESIVSFSSTLDAWKQVMGGVVQRHRADIEGEKTYLLERIRLLERSLAELDAQRNSGTPQGNTGGEPK